MPIRITNQTQCSIADCIETATDGVTQGTGEDAFSKCGCANALAGLAGPDANTGAANIARLFAVSASVIGLAAVARMTAGEPQQAGEAPTTSPAEHKLWANRLIAQAEHMEKKGLSYRLVAESLEAAARHLEAAEEYRRAADVYYKLYQLIPDRTTGAKITEEAQKKLEALERSAELSDKAGAYSEAADAYSEMIDKYLDEKKWLKAAETGMKKGEALRKGRFYLAAKRAFEEALVKFELDGTMPSQIKGAQNKISESTLRWEGSKYSIYVWLELTEKGFKGLDQEAKFKRVEAVYKKLTTAMRDKGLLDFTVGHVKADDGSVSFKGIEEAVAYYDDKIKREVEQRPERKKAAKAARREALRENALARAVTKFDKQMLKSDPAAFLKASLAMGEFYEKAGKYYAAEAVYDHAARGVADLYPVYPNELGIVLLRKAEAMRAQGFAEENLYDNALKLIATTPADFVIEHLDEITDTAARLAEDLDARLAGKAYDVLALALVKRSRLGEAAELAYQSGTVYLKTRYYSDAARAFDNAYRIADLAGPEERRRRDAARSAFKACVLMDAAPGVFELLKWELGERAKDAALMPGAVRIAVERLWPRMREKAFEMFVYNPINYFLFLTRGMHDRKMLELEAGELDAIYEEIMRSGKDAKGVLDHLVDQLEARIEDVPAEVLRLFDPSVKPPPNGPMSNAGSIVTKDGFEKMEMPQVNVGDDLLVEVWRQERMADKANAKKSEGLLYLLEAREMEGEDPLKIEGGVLLRADISAKYSLATNILISTDPEYARTHPDAILTAARRLWGEGQYELAGRSFGRCADFFKEQGMTKLAAWTYMRQGAAFSRSGAHHWAAQAFYEAREQYSNLASNSVAGAFTKETNNALKRIQQAVKNDLLPQVEEALKEKLGKRTWGAICRNRTAKTALVDHAYTQIQEAALHTFYKDARDPNSEFANYGGLRNGGARELAARLDIDVEAINSVMGGTGGKGSPQLLLPPTAVGGAGRAREAEMIEKMPLDILLDEFFKGDPGDIVAWETVDRALSGLRKAGNFDIPREVSTYIGTNRGEARDRFGKFLVRKLNSKEAGAFSEIAEAYRQRLLSGAELEEIFEDVMFMGKQWQMPEMQADNGTGVALLKNAKKAGKGKADLYYEAIMALIEHDPNYAEEHPEELEMAGQLQLKEGQYLKAGDAFGTGARFLEERVEGRLIAPSTEHDYEELRHAAEMYYSQGLAYTEAGAFRSAARAFYKANTVIGRTQYSHNYDYNFYNRAMTSLREALEKDIRPSVEKALKKGFGEAGWVEVGTNKTIKEALVKIRYAEVEAMIVSAFTGDVRSGAATFAEYERLKRGGVEELIQLPDADMLKALDAVRRGNKLAAKVFAANEYAAAWRRMGSAEARITVDMPPSKKFRIQVLKDSAAGLLLQRLEVIHRATAETIGRFIPPRIKGEALEWVINAVSRNVNSIFDSGNSPLDVDLSGLIEIVRERVPQAIKELPEELTMTAEGRDASDRPGGAKRPRSPGRPERPAAAGHERGRDGVDGKGRGRDREDSDGRDREGRGRTRRGLK